jgi:hypothetical protein
MDEITCGFHIRKRANEPCTHKAVRNAVRVNRFGYELKTPVCNGHALNEGRRIANGDSWFDFMEKLPNG